MLRLVDVSRYQVERTNPLDLAAAKTAGYAIANIALTGGRGYTSGPWAQTYTDRARTLDMGVSTYHWLDGRTTGAAQAAAQLARMRTMFGTGLGGFAHIVDIEETGGNGITPPTWAHVRDYVTAMQNALGRHIAIYSGRWWWAPRDWPGATLTPWLMGAPMTGYLHATPSATSAAWAATYGGWDQLAIMQWGVAPLPGTGDCSLSVIRDHGIWADLTGGDTLMPAADPGNAQPDAWVGRPAPAALLDDLDDTAHRLATAHAGVPDVRGLVNWVNLQAREHPAHPLDLIPRGATETCAPAISAEMNDWIDLGGSSSGCVGDSNHGTGFHRSANSVPPTDYSRRRDPNGADGPFTNWNWACAGDFRHGGNPVLRAMHKAVLALLRQGAFPMICEMIVQPDAGGPVMYWARWEGVENLRVYTGSGHDLWSHFSWFRSMADRRPSLWKEANVALTDADAIKVFNTDNAMPNRPWRSDITTNPKVTAASAAVLTWDEAHAARTAAEAAKLAADQIKVTLTAVLAAAKSADDSAEIVAAVNKATADLKADYSRQFAEAQALEIARDTAALRQLLDRLDQVGSSGLTPDMLRIMLRDVYGEAFSRAASSRPNT
jgi:glycosyl hydrolase family 25